MIDDELVRAHRARAMSPDHPFLRALPRIRMCSSSARETVNPFYAKSPSIVQKAMDKFAKLTGRQYRLFDYVGRTRMPSAWSSFMASGGETRRSDGQTIWSKRAKGRRCTPSGCTVRSIRRLSSLPCPRPSKSLAVLDRHQGTRRGRRTALSDVTNALFENGQRDIKAIGGRYGLSSKEFTPAMVKAVFDELKKTDRKTTSRSASMKM